MKKKTKAASGSRGRSGSSARGRSPSEKPAVSRAKKKSSRKKPERSRTTPASASPSISAASKNAVSDSNSVADSVSDSAKSGSATLASAAPGPEKSAVAGLREFILTRLKKTGAASPSAEAKTEILSRTRSAGEESLSNGESLEHPQEERHIRTLSRADILPYLAGIILLGAGVLTFIVYRSYAWPIFIAMLFYVAFSPLYNRMLGLFGGRSNLAASVSTVFVISIIMLPASFLVRHLITQAIDFIRNIRDFLGREDLIDYATSIPLLADSFTEEPFFWVNLNDSLRSYLSGYTHLLDPDKLVAWLGNAYAFVTGGISVTAGFAANLMMGLIILFFLFRDGSSFYEFMADALPFPRVITSRFVRRMKRILRTVLLGNVFVSLIQGTIIGVMLYLFGFSNSILYGVIAGIFSLIPIIGTSVVWIPASLYLVLADKAYGAAIFLALLGLSTYLFMENIFKPKLLDRRLGIHPLLLFFAILGGIAEFGITGVILGPLIVTLFMTIWSIYHIWGDREESSLPESAENGDRLA